MVHDVEFGAHAISFRRYPFWPAQVSGGGALAYGDIADYDAGANPPEIRTVHGETLFVAADHRDALTAAGDAAGLAQARRADVWQLLLTPYLDTEVTADDSRRVRAQLAELGFAAGEVDEIQRRVRSAMLAYNAIAWEWVHLGLYDVLVAMRQSFSIETLRCRLWPPRFRAFYSDAMRIAERGRQAR